MPIARNRVHFVILIITTVDASVQTTVSKPIDAVDLSVGYLLLLFEADLYKSCNNSGDCNSNMSCYYMLCYRE